MVSRKEIQESKTFQAVRDHRVTCPLWQKGYCKECSPSLVDFASELIKELDIEEVAVYNFCLNETQRFQKKILQQSAERGRKNIEAQEKDALKERGGGASFEPATIVPGAKPA